MATPSDRARERTATATNDHACVSTEAIYPDLRIAELRRLELGPRRRESLGDPRAVVEAVVEGARDAAA
jgi:hypothetical protein